MCGDTMWFGKPFTLDSMIENVTPEGSKLAESADKYRKEGNKLFDEGKLFAAIAQYNKSLVCARDDPARAALCYGNRSAVYLALECFKHCLHSIELAEPNFPPANIQRLRDRRERCLELMRKIPDKSYDVFKHDYKLSYKPNPKLPFFIDALEVRENLKYGKHLITNRDLNAGDVIAVMDKPWRAPIARLDVNHILGCYQCGDTRNGDLIPGKCQGRL